MCVSACVQAAVRAGATEAAARELLARVVSTGRKWDGHLVKASRNCISLLEGRDEGLGQGQGQGRHMRARSCMIQGRINHSHSLPECRREVAHIASA